MCYVDFATESQCDDFSQVSIDLSKKSSFLVKPVMPLIGNLLPHATFILALCINLQQAVITLQNLWLHQRSHCYKCRLVTIKFLFFSHSFSFFSFFLIWFILFFSKHFQKFSYYTWASIIHNGNSSETLTFFSGWH